MAHNIMFYTKQATFKVLKIENYCS